MHSLARLALLAMILLAGPSVIAPPAFAQVPDLAIQGRVEHPRTFTAADIRAQPAVTLQIVRTVEGAPRTSAYTGALLWPLLAAANPIDEPGRSTRLQHTILARGADSYAAALALGELDPGFANKPVIVAYERDGKPLPALHLIVPGDTRAGRSVRDLVAIEVR